ncbi:MAG: hypothetical protein H6983_00765 [Ectothiorhodospiraceae bacterium]|nr:hypothetical protein [Ectothiorhodospiraceae bacterium]
MSHAVWMLLYAIERADREAYLDWFHRVHIPDKLARPGYTWAAHYAVTSAAGSSEPGGYVALFGGESTRVFHDPSPAQLKLRQDADTRRMMGMRRAGSGTILCEAWRDGRLDAAVAAPAIRLHCIDAGGADEDLEAWLAQERVPTLLAGAGCSGVRKWLGASGAVRHAVVEEYASLAACAGADDRAPPTDWSARVAAAVREPVGPPRVATRIWPAA